MSFVFYNTKSLIKGLAKEKFLYATKDIFTVAMETSAINSIIPELSNCIITPGYGDVYARP